MVIVAGALAATIELDRYPHGLTDALFLQQMYDAIVKLVALCGASDVDVGTEFY